MSKFIAAMDNSGGSAGGVLDLYEQEWTEENKMERIHEFRLRMINSPNFNSDNILAAIVYKDSVERGVVDVLKDKGIDTFLKIDSGIKEDGTLKQFPISAILNYAKENGCTGTKMRSVIDCNMDTAHEQIQAIVDQQFVLANLIHNVGLMPIIEPEISIRHSAKAELELILRGKLLTALEAYEGKCILKLTLPEQPNFYKDLQLPNVHKIVGLSGGYNTAEACDRLSNNNCMIASFSRALAEGLKYNVTDDDLNAIINNNIKMIAEASNESSIT